MSGKIYYGLHFYPGVAQYNDANGNDYKILLRGETLKKMDKTMQGKPAFVEHVGKVETDRKKLQNAADAWVVESFYNQYDGKHWSKFITVTDEADEAIANGFTLSNAYDPVFNGQNGIWNAISYENEVVDGCYEHLAIVQNPRYNESIILTPEQFKEYNENLKQDLERDRISNSQQEKKMGVKDLFFKRTKIENSVDYENTFVCLPKTKKEFSLMQIVNAMDDVEEKKKLNEADLDTNVKLDDGTVMSLKELIERHKNIQSQLEQLLKEREGSNEDNLSPEGEIQNEDDPEEDKDKPAKPETPKNKKMENSLQKTENFNQLKNAHLTVNNSQEERLYTVQDKLQLGKELY